jgi:sugar phosphate isomerase/epimerase
MHQYQIGLALSKSLGFSIEEGFPLLKKHGFEAIFTGLGTPEERRVWADKCAEYGLFYSSIHAPFKRAADMWEDTLEGDEGERELIESIDACVEVDAPIAAIHPIIGFDKHTPTPIGLARYRRVAEYAAKKNIKAAIENVEGEEYLDYLMDGLRDYDSIGFCLDTGHEVCYNRERDLLADYGDRLCYLHINSNVGVTSPEGIITYRDDAHMLPFDGKANMDFLVERLKKYAYKGVLMMELSRGNHKERNTNDRYLAMTDDEYIAEAAAQIKRIREMMEQ